MNKKNYYLLPFLVYCGHAFGDPPSAAELTAQFKAFLVFTEDPPAKTQAEFDETLQNLVTTCQAVPRAQAFAAMITAVAETNEELPTFTPGLRYMLKLLLDEFQFTENEIWDGAQGFFDYHSPMALAWLLRFFIEKPSSFEDAESPSWSGKRYLDYLNDPAHSETQKLSLWFCFMKWDEEFALDLAYDVFDPTVSRAEELKALFAIARPTMFLAGKIDEAAKQALTSLAEQPEAWVRLFVTESAFWFSMQDIYPVLQALGEDEVAIVRVYAKNQLSTFRPPTE